MSVLAEERKRIIIEMIARKGKVKVNDLAQNFEVSTETIRRYLEDLESENKLKKVYGGAIKVKVDEEPPMFERNILRIEEKKRIGTKAVSFIQKDDIIFIDEGSTTIQMAHSLTHLSNVTVITNSFPFVALLMKYENNSLFTGDIIFLGGHVNSNHFRASGSLAEQMAKDFYVNKAFISIDGIHPDLGITSFDLEKCMLSKMFMQNCDKAYILTDYSKLHIKATCKIGTLTDQNTFIISDVPQPVEWNNCNLNWISC
ncbi:DeoR/GlpR family DNA-binding transcription regulator [Bacillus massiliigorillae]|uniref:DeoR/GlpR family DNA-binding transcription regulator n=1 Tax=Bacillus massiliigorillae TaxID=1243664 RepID=UPI00039F9183|nr:DeoR/GlpR family DNA-binding transcription regulator [Bacillus massiliigorillae]